MVRNAASSRPRAQKKIRSGCGQSTWTSGEMQPGSFPQALDVLDARAKAHHHTNPSRAKILPVP